MSDDNKMFFPEGTQITIDDQPIDVGKINLKECDICPEHKEGLKSIIYDVSFKVDDNGISKEFESFFEDVQYGDLSLFVLLKVKIRRLLRQIAKLQIRFFFQKLLFRVGFYRKPVRIDWFPNYTIDRSGMVRNSKGKILAIHYRGSKGGKYPYVTLYRRGYKCNFKKSVHRLVAEHFIPNPLRKPEVNHKKKNIDRYSFLDLEWTTAKENAQHREATRKPGETL